MKCSNLHDARWLTSISFSFAIRARMSIKCAKRGSAWKLPTSPHGLLLLPTEIKKCPIRVRLQVIIFPGSQNDSTSQHFMCRSVGDCPLSDFCIAHTPSPRHTLEITQPIRGKSPAAFWASRFFRGALSLQNW